MANGDLNISLILKLVDQVTAPARQALASLERIGDVTETVGRSGVAWANQQLDATRARRAELQGEAMGVAATGFAIYQSLKPAVEFETAMAGVSKVIDFDTPEGFKELQSDILDLTTEGGLPMAADGLAEIIEAAGQAGVVDKALPDEQEREQLIAFARDAAQMGIAFDISAGQAGDAMAQWRTAMGLSQNEALSLGNAINHLSNNMNATAPGLVDIIRRQGAVAQTAGLAETEIAALSAALLSGGASPEVAATGLKNFLGALTAGEAATARQSAVLQQLGIDAEDLARSMQVDAKGGIIEVMEALSELPEHAQGAALSQLFGEESKGAIAPLLTNLELLHKAFGLVSDPGVFDGSMLEEYQKQAATTANAIKVTQNYMTGLAVAAGSIILPELNELLAIFQPIVKSVTEWAEANPELITLIFRSVLALTALKIASIGLRWSFLTLLTPFLKMIRFASYFALGLGKTGRLLMWVSKGPTSLLIKAIKRIGLAVMANPIGLVAAAVIGLAYAIYDNWDQIVSWFKGKVDEVASAFDDGIINGVFKLVAEFNPFTLAYEGANGLFEYITGWSFGDVFREITESRPFQYARESADNFLQRVTGWSLDQVFDGLKLLNPFELAQRSAEAWLSFVSEWDLSSIFTSIDTSRPFASAMENLDEFLLKTTGMDLGQIWDGVWNVSPFAQAMEGARELRDFVRNLNFADVVNLIREQFADIDLFEAGVAMIQSLWDGAVELVTAMVNDIKAKLAGMVPDWVIHAYSYVSGEEIAPEGARDRGGPVRAGMPYLVGERAPEIFVPGVAGSILPARVLKTAMAASAIAAPVAAMPSQSEIIESVDRRPAMVQTPSQTTIEHRIEVGDIHIHAVPGMSAEDVARAVKRELERIQDHRRADLHDGYDY